MSLAMLFTVYVIKKLGAPTAAILASPVATGEVARHRRDDRGARDVSHYLCDKEVNPLMAPPPPLSRHLPRSGGGGFGAFVA